MIQLLTAQMQAHYILSYIYIYIYVCVCVCVCVCVMAAPIDLNIWRPSSLVKGLIHDGECKTNQIFTIGLKRGRLHECATY